MSEKRSDLRVTVKTDGRFSGPLKQVPELMRRWLPDRSRSGTGHKTGFFSGAIAARRLSAQNAYRTACVGGHPDMAPACSGPDVDAPDRRDADRSVFEEQGSGTSPASAARNPNHGRP
jgi:hypothetical protein